MRLSAPDPRHGHYTLSDGSRVYPSSIRPGYWIAWRYERHERGAAGVRYACGSILMDASGICYYRSPEAAAKAIGREKKLARKRP